MFHPVFIADEDFRPVVVTLIKGTYKFDVHGNLQLAEDQEAVSVGGELATNTPISSYKYEPEIALQKLTTDVALVGHAHPPSPSATEVDAGVKVGPVRKVARVFGDRYWVWKNGSAVLTKPRPLNPVPLVWENAFGGRDEARSTHERALIEPRNPVGVGFGKPLQREGDRLRLPNIENPKDLVSTYGHPVTPWGFGFVSPDWEPRARYAGTYDSEWERTRKPLLPHDFDRRFHNAAAPGLIAPAYLRGNEDVSLLNVTPAPRVSFRLPGVPPPPCRVVLRGRRDTVLNTNLDTVIINADEQRVFLLWRAYAITPGGPHDVSAFEVGWTD